MRKNAQRVQIILRRVGHFTVFLCQQNQIPVILVGSLDQLKAVFLGNRNRQQHSREQHRVLDRQHVIIPRFHFFFVYHVVIFNS